MRICKTANLINAYFLLGAISALALTPSAWANVTPNTKQQCPDSKAPSSKDHLSAHYRVTSPQGQTWDMHLMRNQEQLIISRNEVTFEGWNNSEYVRYFPQEKRSVTYRKSDLLALNIQYDHDQLYHVVAPSLLSTLDKTQTTQHACYTTQAYQGQLNGHPLNIEWIASLGLPHYFTLGEQHLLQYQLQQVSALTAVEFNNLIKGYRDIDFADVGDSESDPFIAKMINQGFIQHGSSGFYNSDGQNIDSAGGHSSHSH